MAQRLRGAEGGAPRVPPAAAGGGAFVGCTVTAVQGEAVAGAEDIARIARPLPNVTLTFAPEPHPWAVGAPDERPPWIDDDFVDRTQDCAPLRQRPLPRGAPAWPGVFVDPAPGRVAAWYNHKAEVGRWRFDRQEDATFHCTCAMRGGRERWVVAAWVEATGAGVHDGVL